MIEIGKRYRFNYRVLGPKLRATDDWENYPVLVISKVHLPWDSGDAYRVTNLVTGQVGLVFANELTELTERNIQND